MSAAKTLPEVIQKALNNEFKVHMRNELRDWLAHSVARFCKQTNNMESYDLLVAFIQELLKHADE